MNGRRYEEFIAWFEATIWHGLWGYAPDVPLNRAVLETYWRCWQAGAADELPRVIADIEGYLYREKSKRDSPSIIAWESSG